MAIATMLCKCDFQTIDDLGPLLVVNHESQLKLDLQFTGEENSTCVPKRCTIINKFTKSGKMVAQQLSSLSLHAFPDGGWQSVPRPDHWNCE